MKRRATLASRWTARGAAALGTMLVTVASSAAGQALRPEQRVRVTAPALGLSGQVGLVRWLDADSLVLAAPARPLVVPRAALAGVDTSAGRHGHALAGLVVGAVTGFAVGAALFAPGSNACTGSGDYPEYCRLYRAGIVVGAAGLGALAGGLIRPERWDAVAPDALSFDAASRRP